MKLRNVAGVVAALALNFAQPMPYGPCARSCGEAAVHRAPDGELVCRSHLPPETIWAPFLGKQERFMAATERYVLFGGSAGPGKSDCAIRKWIPQWRTEHDRWRRGEIAQSEGHVLILRRQIPELLQLVARFKRFFKKLDPGAEWFGGEGKSGHCKFSCGYVVQFAGIDNEDDWEKYYGPQYTMIVFDEATQFTITQIEQLDSRIRSTDPVLSKSLQLILCTNPVGNATKLWLRQRYVEAAAPEQTVIIRTKLRDGRTVDATQIYIPANIYDNPEILRDGQYEANLMRKGAGMRRALLDGDWYVDAGSWAGDDWVPDVHVCKPFAIPESWTRFKSADYGFSSNSSVQWWAKDFDDNMVCYRSLTVRGKTAQELGALIREIESEPLVVDVDGVKVKVTEGEWDKELDRSNVWGPMDQSLWSKMGETGPSRGEILEQMGCGFYRADRSRESAAEQIRNRLRKRTPNAKGEMVIPGIRWFNTCKTKQRDRDNKWKLTGPIITIPVVPFDDANPDVWDTKSDDHDLDAAGYGALDRMLAPERDDAGHFDELAARRADVGRVSGWPGGR
jgi:hypothetical protein